MGTEKLKDFGLLPPHSTTIPAESGSNPVSHARNRRFKKIYAVSIVCWAAAWYFNIHPRLQHMCLALAFPGGGFIGLGGFWLIGFVINAVLFCGSLFLWFATGNIIAPFMTWFGESVLIAALPGAARPTSAYRHGLVVALAVATYVFIVRKMSRIRNAQILRRDERNAYLPEVLAKVASNGDAEAENDDDLEIPEDVLKHVRWQLDIAMLDKDDWSAFDVIDQFQPAALRYQINEASYTLAFINRFYTPSFRGSYLQEAQRKLIHKYCQERVLNYWKWECLWGKLTTDYEPVLKDNIMLTGFLLLALEWYRAATLDDTFTEDGALVLEIDNDHRYPHSSRTLAEALLSNWSGSSYCLFPCEPNWIYSYCNLVGINAIKSFDTNEGTNHTSSVIDRFRKGFIEEFTDLDGSCVPIKSAITGFVIPGLIGVMNDLSCATLTASVMPDVSARTFAIVSKEILTLDDDGELCDVMCLVGADKMDPGIYQASMVSFYTHVLSGCKMRGKKAVVQAVERLIEKDEDLGRTEQAGVVKFSNVSVLMNSGLLRARLMIRNGLNRMIEESMPLTLKHGPILAGAKYPEVLVAKARSHHGRDLELVLYPGTEENRVMLDLAQLQAGKRYKVNGEQTFVAMGDGKASIEITLSGRTVVWVRT